VRIFWHVLAYHGRRPEERRETHKIDADGRDVALCVCVVGETEQQARLSDARVSDEQELEEVVVSVAQAVSGGCGGVPNSARQSALHGETLWTLELAWIPACARCCCPSACGGGRRAKVTYYSGFMMAASWRAVE
jgi:hypothetical protein